MHVSCPQCGGPGEVTWSGVVASGDGSISQVVVRCPDLHWSVRPSSEVAAIVDPWSLLAAQAAATSRRPRLLRAA
ncbi:MAG TPA: hypothetical protein VIT65_01745 [Microlunatus sp.]